MLQTQSALSRHDAFDPTTPAELVVRLYDEALYSLSQSIQAIEENRIEDRCHAVNNAVDIISELYLALDMEKGGDIADSLSTIYGFILGNIQEINFNNDPEPARSAINLLLPLRNSWFELAERQRAPDTDDDAFADQDLIGFVIADRALSGALS